MPSALPILYLARHGETAWSITGQHTGRSDIPLTDRGERNAGRLGERLAGMQFARVFTSPLKRAAHTCALAGFAAVAELDPDLLEWDYGKYEGLTRAQILQDRPDWQIFRDGCPGGETLADVAARADRVISRARGIGDHVLLFSSGHILRVLAARWLGQDPSAGKYLLLGTASLSALSYEHDFTDPAIEFWNDTRHIGP